MVGSLHIANRISIGGADDNGVNDIYCMVSAGFI